MRIKGDVSSQFLSALLMVAPLADKPVTIEVEGPLVSQPYVDMTLAMMTRIGLKVVTQARAQLRSGPMRQGCGP